MLEGVPYFINGMLQLELITAVKMAHAYQINSKTVAILSSYGQPVPFLLIAGLLECSADVFESRYEDLRSR